MKLKLFILVLLFFIPNQFTWAKVEFEKVDIKDGNLNTFFHGVVKVENDYYSQLLDKIPKTDLFLTVIQKYRSKPWKYNFGGDGSIEYFIKRLEFPSNEGLNLRLFYDSNLGTKYLVSNGNCYREARKHIVYSKHGPKNILLEASKAESLVNGLYENLNFSVSKTSTNVFSGEFKKTIGSGQGLILGRSSRVTLANIGPVYYICLKDLISFRESELTLKKAIKTSGLKLKISKSQTKPFVEKQIWGYFFSPRERKSTLPIFSSSSADGIDGVYLNRYLYSKKINNSSCPSRFARSYFSNHYVPIFDRRENFCEVEYIVGCSEKHYGWVKCDRQYPLFEMLIRNEQLVTLKKEVQIYDKVNGRSLSKAEVIKLGNLYKDYWMRVTEKKLVNGTLWIKLNVEYIACDRAPVPPKKESIWVKAWLGTSPAVEVSILTC